jgi:hypothetical protein
MFCRRVGTLTKRSQDELEALKQQHQEITERLVTNYRSVLERIDPDGSAGTQEQAALHAARTAVARAGGFVAQYNDIDKVTAHHGDNHVPLVARHFRNDRAAMLAMVGALGMEATSAEEVSWARAKTTTDQHCLTLLVLLKCYQRLGYFLRPEQIPAEMAEHVRGCAD